MFLLAAALIAPLFSAGYFNNWGSIESTFIADARFLAGHLPHPRWQPLWYGGTRFDYIYPPALRYGSALISKAGGVETVRGYHIYTALLYALGIAGVYLLIRTGTASRGAAWLGAAASAVASPVFLLWPELRADSEHLAPQRLHVLLKYGEGPHISALAVIPFALAAAYLALRGRRPAAFALASLCCALVALNNFYGATALAIFFPILAWSVWVTRIDRRVWLRAAGMAALAYALTAFWLVPSYFRITLDNLSIVSQKGNVLSVIAAAATAAAFGLWSWMWARGKSERAWTVFVAGSFVFFSLNVPGNHFAGFRVAGEPLRLVPEWDLTAILAGTEILRRLWGLRPARAPWAPRAAAIVLACVAFVPARHYVRHAWDLYPQDPRYRERVEYKLQNWVFRNMPESRVFVAGSVRFWYDAWNDLPQVGGGSEQGLLNPIAMPATWETILGPQPEPGRLWLVALGADAVIVTDKTSQEIYHDVAYPRKFDGVLPVLQDDGQGNRIYQVPRRYPGLARVVDCGRMAAAKPVRFNYDVERLRAYTGVLEGGPDARPEFRWEGTEAMRVRAAIGTGQCLAVQVSYDPYWRAYADGRRVEVRKDALGQMLVSTPPGTRDLRLVFELPFENLAGYFVSLTGMAVVIVLLGERSARRAR